MRKSEIPKDALFLYKDLDVLLTRGLHLFYKFE